MKLFRNLFFRPIMILQILDPLKIRYGDAAGIG